MFSIYVVQRRHPKAVYCGRPSPLGNRYKMQTEADRDLVCDLYHKWFYANIEMLKPELNKLYQKGLQEGELYLGCYCSPKRCHCDTIKEYLSNMIHE